MTSNASSRRGREFNQNVLDVKFKLAAVGHPILDHVYVPAELAPPAVEEEMRRKIAELPIDHLSITVLDGRIRTVFDKGAIAAAKVHTLWVGFANAAITNLSGHIGGMETQLDTWANELDEALDDAATIRRELDGESPVPPNEAVIKPPGEPAVPPNEPATKRIPPRLGPSWVKRLLVVFVAVFGLVVDIVNFKGVLNLLNSTLSEWENDLLASGFSAAVAGLSLIIGTTAGRRRRNAGTQRWSRLGMVIPLAIVLGMIVTSLLIRALNTTVVDNDPFHTGAVAASNPFGGAPGWLSATFYTMVLIASSYATFDEARTVARFAPYYRVRSQIKDLIAAIRDLVERLDYATGLRTDWLASIELSLELRDLAIEDHAASCDDYFSTSRMLVAKKVGDPIVSDAAEHAPTINVVTDVPLMDPPFRGTSDEPPSTAAA